MKKVLIYTISLILGYAVSVQALNLTPTDCTPGTCWTGAPISEPTGTGSGQINPLNASQVESIVGYSGSGLLELYKRNVPGDEDPVGIEEGLAKGLYSTIFSNTASDPSGATITWDGSGFINDADYLVLKDGANNPYYYIFDISENGWNWDGKETIALSSFWPGSGSISHVSIFGESEPVPEPATMLLLGTGLVGIAGLARRKAR